MNSIICSDLYRYRGLKGRMGFIRGLLIPGFRYTYFLRKASMCRPGSISHFFYKILLRHYSFKFGYQIPISTQLGEGFYIGHFGTLVINKETKIGKWCNVAHNVTIGQANRGERIGSPTIGDFVWIGTGSVIVGRIVVGSNVLIAPNAYVNFDVPDNSIVVGNPAKVIASKNAVDRYIEFIP